MNLLGTTACPDLAYLCTKVASSSYIYIEILDKLGHPLIWYYTQWGRIKYTCEEPAQRQRKCKAQVLKCLLIFGKDLLQHTHSGEKSMCFTH